MLNMGDAKTFNCTTLINPSNTTYVFDGAYGWQAIPETIVINLILFFFFLIIFIILRRLAWDKKHVNIRRTSKGWLQSIYGDRKLAVRVIGQRQESPIIHHQHDLKVSVLLPPSRSSENDIHKLDHEHHAAAGDDANLHNRMFLTIPGDNHNYLSRASPSSCSIQDSHVNNTVTEDLSSAEIHSENPSPAPQTPDDFLHHDPQQRPPQPQAATVTERILGASIDISNLPTNIQSTFAEVGYKLSDVLLISNKAILESRGNDALQYLLFQQYIIYFLAILTVFCMLVILPVNLQGNEFNPGSQGFARTTILNLPENSSYHWFHVMGAAIISLIGIFMMHRFSKVIELDDEQITRRTLLIRRIPKNKRSKELIASYFTRSIPNCIIEGMQSIYDVRKLTPLTQQLNTIVNARCYCLEHLELKGKRLKIRPACFGEIGCLCGCTESCRQVDGLKYYLKAEEELQQKITAEMARTIANPTGAFLITFRTEKMAQQAYVELRQKQEKAFSFCPFSSSFTQITVWCRNLFRVVPTNDYEVAQWIVSYAPYPDDINWCDITVNLRMQWVRSIVNNLLLLVLFVFISTPTVILNASDTLKLSNIIGWVQYFLPSEIGSKVPELIGPLILVIAASALPAIVTLACQYIAYSNLSGKNHAIMWKVYLFLVLMVIIWPSLGLTSLKAFLLMMLNKGDFPWNCLFPVKIGSFFVNYTIQNAFLGNIMELMRIPELLVYMWYMIIGRSRAEVDTASQSVVWDFSIGVRYPRFLLIFAMVVTYSVSCPLITAAGLLYMVIKHLIDRYNIYYVYNPSKINSKIHSTAIMFVHIAFLMMQAQIFTVTLIRTGYSRAFGLALVVFVFSLLVFSGHLFFYMLRNINHLTYRATRKESKALREYCACSYLPPVLYNLTRYNLSKSPSTVSTGVGM